MLLSILLQSTLSDKLHNNECACEPSLFVQDTMGAFSSKSSDSYKKSSRVRSNNSGSGSARQQPNELMTLTKKQNKVVPPKVRKSSEKKSDKPSVIKKPVTNHGNNNDLLYDGIPEYQMTLCLYQKSRSMRTKQVGAKPTIIVTFFPCSKLFSYCLSPLPLSQFIEPISVIISLCKC